MSVPKVTIVIPNHNYSQWIASCLTSVADDPYTNRSIVIVDDGSTDDSVEKLCGLLCINPKKIFENSIYDGSFENIPVKLCVSKPARGPSAARNMGIKLAWDNTDIFGFLDADDMYLPGKTRKSVNMILQDPANIGAVYTDYDTVNTTNGNKIRVYNEPFHLGNLLKRCHVHSACMVNKMALDKCGLYDEEMRTCEDWDLWLRISEKFIITHIPESLMHVRVGMHNSTNSVNQETWQKNWKRIGEKIKERQTKRA